MVHLRVAAPSGCGLLSRSSWRAFPAKAQSSSSTSRPRRAPRYCAKLVVVLSGPDGYGALAELPVDRSEQFARNASRTHAEGRDRGEVAERRTAVPWPLPGIAPSILRPVHTLG